MGPRTSPTAGGLAATGPTSSTEMDVPAVCAHSRQRVSSTM